MSEEKKGIKVPAAKMQKKSKEEKINLIHLLTGRQRSCLRWKKKVGWRRDLRRNEGFRSQLVIPAKKIRKISQRWKTPESRKGKRWVLQSRSLTVPVQDKSLVTRDLGRKKWKGGKKREKDK